ncbi:MAG: germination protein YpeB [Eubacteriales bacterium]|jgi:spore germination protein
MKRRNKIRLISYTVALILVLSGFVYTGYAEARHYRWLLEAGYQHNFAELTTSIEQISTTLQKGRYASSPSLIASLSAEVSRQSAMATYALASLPFSHVELERTAKFLSQVGDYAYNIARKEASGSELTKDDKQNIATLSDAAYQLSVNLNDLYNRVYNDGLSIGTAIYTSNPEEQIGAVAETIQDIETQFPEYAGLIYDGPFSDHISKMTPMMLQNAKEVTREDARKRVSEIFKLDLSIVKDDGEGNGNIPVYSFVAETESGTMYIDITKTGGFIHDMMHSRIVEQSKLSVDDCIKKAIDFLSKNGFENMETSYYISRNNILTVNFAYTEDDITYYPDLIKVSIAQDDGQIVGLEFLGYLMSHGERTLPEVNVSEESVREKVADGLTVENVRLAVIPSMGKYERLCYELKCVDDYGQRCLIYVNAETGIEEQILILIEGDDGVLTI